ncbi:MAG TPA: hypothetical protein VFI25_15265 [Planctomycetota bacterium]|nr:hypothetical protein [Planctomycetota bacterium]
MRFLALLGILAALVGAAVLAERLFPSEKDRLRERLDACARAIEAEDTDALAGMLSPSFRFEGEGFLGSGDRGRALELVRRLAGDPRAMRIRIGEVEADFDGDGVEARVDGSGSYGRFERRPGHERFEGTMTTFAATLGLRRDPAGTWILESGKIETRDPFSRLREGRRAR